MFDGSHIPDAAPAVDETLKLAIRPRGLDAAILEVVKTRLVVNGHETKPRGRVTFDDVLTVGNPCRIIRAIAAGSPK